MGGAREILAGTGKMEGDIQEVRKQAMVKRQDASRRDQFGGSVLGAFAGGYAAPGGGGTPVHGCNHREINVG